MQLKIRKFVHHLDEIHIDGVKQASRPLRLAAVAVVLKNPWPLEEYTENLSPLLEPLANELGSLMVPRLFAMVGPDKIQAFGKAAVVGLRGEVEHGCALIHTLRFGNHLREAVRGKAFIPSTNKLGAANASITIPLKHKELDGARSHFLTVEFAVPDAPRDDEIIVALAVADGGRVHHRIGDRYEDMKVLGVDQTEVAR